MKNAFKVKAMLRIAGIIALVAAIGFSMIACGDEEGSNNGGGSSSIVGTYYYQARTLMGARGLL